MHQISWKPRFRFLTWAVLLLAFLVFDSAQARTNNQIISPGKVSTQSLVVGARKRTYRLHIPKAYDEHQAYPLVIVLHGHGQTARRIMRVSEMNTKADAAGFMAVYPEGSSWMNIPWRSWNAGNCCGYAMARGVDDVGFIRDLIDEVKRTYRIDPKRIYATGVSNGAMMAYRLGCELTELIAAVAPVAGSMDEAPCMPSEPVSSIIFHGTSDTHILYKGGISPHAKDGRVDRPLSETVDMWVAQNECTPFPKQKREGDIIRETYSGCRNKTEVTVYTIEGGGHAWPGGKRGWLFGSAPTREISASDLMWEFFARHPKP